MATDVAAEIVADVRLERHRAHVLTSVAGQWLRDNGWYGVQSSSPPGGSAEEDKEEEEEEEEEEIPGRKRRRQRRQQHQPHAGNRWELTLEETVYQHARGAVRVLSGDAELDATQLWQACCVEQEHLPAVYATYQHWRSLGWIPRPGLQYGVTFLLYRDVVDARQHQHAE